MTQSSHQTPRGASVYFHAPCMDGIVSAVVASDFVERVLGWSETALIGVNYDARDTWLSRALGARSVVLDFLYHPAADMWVDHHSSSFLSDELESQFRSRQPDRLQIYDPTATSCAILLYRHIRSEFGYSEERYADLVNAADVTDSASYRDVHEAIFPKHPVFQINMTLAVEPTEGYSEFLVRVLRKHSVEDVRSLSEVEFRFERITTLIADGLRRFESASSAIRHDVVCFDVDGSGSYVSRYAPFYFYPQARYSVGRVWNGKTSKITAMRNPWMNFESVHLGAIAQQFGGGGHHRVGSVRADDRERSNAVLEAFTEALERNDALKRARMVTQ